MRIPYNASYCFFATAMCLALAMYCAPCPLTLSLLLPLLTMTPSRTVYLIFLALMTPYSAGTRLSPLRVMPPTKLLPTSLANMLLCHSVLKALAWSTLVASLTPPS